MTAGGLDLFRLLVLVTVVERNGYSAAAEHLNVSQATASFHVQALERFFGAKLLVYALFPEANISIHVFWGLKHQNTVFATGKSIIDRSSRTDVGGLMLEYGGGGHEAAGTCQVANDDAERVLGELVARITADG